MHTRIVRSFAMAGASILVTASFALGQPEFDTRGKRPETGYQPPTGTTWDTLSWSYWNTFANVPARCVFKNLQEARARSREWREAFPPSPPFGDPPNLAPHLRPLPKGQLFFFSQSPRRLAAKGYVGTIPVRGQTLGLAYQAGTSNTLKIKNTGHTVELVLDPGAEEYKESSDKPPRRTITHRGVEYDLKQLHFHHPSEHLLEQKRYPMELHIVHEALPKRLVLAVFLEIGSDTDYNSKLKPLFDKMPSLTKKDDHAELPISGQDLLDMLPSNRSYLEYGGSLTTPPCDEGVTWIALTTPVRILQTHLDNFKQAIRYGDRLPFPVNARPLMDYARE